MHIEQIAHNHPRALLLFIVLCVAFVAGVISDQFNLIETWGDDDPNLPP